MASIEDQISVKLGLKTGEFKAALADANASVSAFGKDGAESASTLTEGIHGVHQAMRTLHMFMTGGGIMIAVKELFSKGVEYAKEHADAVDSDVAAMNRLSEATHSFSLLIGEGVVKTAGFMETLGLKIGSVIYGMDAAVDAGIALEEENSKAFDDAKAKKLAEATKQLAAAMHQNALDAATDEGKVNILLADRITLQTELQGLKEGTLEYTQKEIEIEKNAGALRKAIAADDKFNQEQINKALTEFFGEMDKGAKKEIEGLTDIDKALNGFFAPLDAISKKKSESTAITAGPQLVAEQGITAEVVKQDKATADRIQHLKDIGEYMKQGWSLGGTTDVKSLSDVQLQSMVLKNQMTQAQLSTGDPNKDAYNSDLQQANLFLASAQQEQQTRRNFTGAVSSFGQSYAEQNYSPTDFSRLMALMNPNAANATAQNVTAIGTTLNKLFPNQATPMISVGGP